MEQKPYKTYFKKPPTKRKAMAQFKLTYFNVKGRAEVIRLIFKAAGQPFEDIRVSYSDTNYKTSSPTGKIPFLEIHENGTVVKLSQSLAIGNLH